MSPALLTLVALGGCEGPSHPLLPSEVSVLAETASGEPVSLLVSLERNARDLVDIRAAEGAQVYDGRRVWAIERDEDGAIAAEDRVTGERHVFAAGPDPRVLQVAARTVFVAGDHGTLACSMKDGRCGLSEVPELRSSHPGPGDGFRVALEGGTLRLYLPRHEPGGLELATGIRRVLGVYWVRDATGEADRVVNRTFRGRARVHATARRVVPDGELEDWVGAAPVVVEAPWELQAGAQAWKGPTDASFSVAATWTGDQVCLAGRVRDDQLVEGDELRVRVESVERLARLDLPADGDLWVRPEWLGASWETCVPTSRLPSRGHLDFVVAQTDVDPGGPTTVISSAPGDAEGVFGEILLDAPEG